MQTPQTFRVDIIRRALSEVRQRGLLVTDDTAACELIGQPVQLVVSAEPNPKVTRPEDLGYVEAVLRGMATGIEAWERKRPCSQRLPAFCPDCRFGAPPSTCGALANRDLRPYCLPERLLE